MVSLLSNLVACIFQPKPQERQNKHGLALPPECHIELTEDDIQNRAVFVIGDVHGCLEELEELMKAAKEVESDIMFVFVGDLVNRGPYSVEVIRKLRTMKTCDVYAVRGNHDESVLREARNFRENTSYELSEKYSWIKHLDESDIDYLSKLPYTISIPSLNSLVVHAGLVPGIPLVLQDLNNLTNMRNIIDKGNQFDGGGLVATNKHEEGEPWVELWSGPEHVYFGHDARRKLQRSTFATGLDTGCCHGGELTGVFMNRTKKFISVKSKQPRAHDYQN